MTTQPGGAQEDVDRRLQWLADLAMLRELAQRYARAADSRDVDAMAELFDPSGTMEGARGSTSVGDHLESLRSAPRTFASSMHVLGDPLIELEPGAARGRTDTYAVVYQFRGPGDEGDDLQLGVRYLDEVVRRDVDGDAGRWVIAHRQSRIEWTRPLPRG